MSTEYLLSNFMADETTGLINNFNGDYSTTPENAIFKPEVGHIAIIKAMTISIEDTGAPDSGKYGNNITLTNGITFKIVNDEGDINPLTNGGSVKTNGDYTRYAQVIEPITFGTGNTFVRVHHNFEQTGFPIILEGDDTLNERFEINFNDDFTGLVSHTFYLSGMLIHNNKRNRNKLLQDYWHIFGEVDNV